MKRAILQVRSLGPQMNPIVHKSPSQRWRLLVVPPLVLSAQVAAIHILNTAHPRFSRDNLDGTVTVVFVQLRLAQGHAASKEDRSRLKFRADQAIRHLRIDVPAIDYEVELNSNAAVAVPTIDPEASGNIAPDVRRASLLPGEGATVVLRIEVLDTGVAGRVDVDVSSGSRQVDQAAIDYARSLRWYPGRRGGAPHTTRIRWAVRLQA